MLALIQRVTKASVTVAGTEISRINSGICLLLGIHNHDTSEDSAYLIRKLEAIRIFADRSDRFEISLKQLKEEGRGPEILVVSQFTLYGDLKKNRPSFTKAKAPAEAEQLYLEFCASLRSLGYTVKEGEFGAYMSVEIVNDGPVTFTLSSDNLPSHKDESHTFRPETE